MVWGLPKRASRKGSVGRRAGTAVKPTGSGFEPKGRRRAEKHAGTMKPEARCLSRNPRGGQCLRDRRHTGPHQSYKGTF